MLNLFNLEGKVAMVTGASRGLGRAMAVALAGAGADIVAVASASENAAQTVSDIEALGRNSKALGCRQDDPADVRRAVRDGIDAFGQVDILVNNAGTIRRAPAEEYSDEDWSMVMDTNLNGLFQFCRGIGKHMLEREQGKIINIASLLSFSGGITVPAYAASKGGLLNLTKWLSSTLAPKVRVNSITPGGVFRDHKDPFLERYINRTPMRRMGKEEDFKGATIFLASEMSGYITGHNLVVDGGITII